MTYLAAAASSGTIFIFGQPISAWTAFVFVLGMLFGFFIRHRI